MILQLIIPGKPMGKQRPRVCKGHAFTPIETVQYETYVRELYVINNFTTLEGAIEADITAYFPIPNSTPKKYLEDMKSGKTYYTKKPDTDNVGKIVLDSLNGIAYKDDSQISILSVTKKYSDNPRVELILKEV